MLKDVSIDNLDAPKLLLELLRSYLKSNGTVGQLYHRERHDVVEQAALENVLAETQNSENIKRMLCLAAVLSDDGNAAFGTAALLEAARPALEGFWAALSSGEVKKAQAFVEVLQAYLPETDTQALADALAATSAICDPVCCQ